MLHYSWRCSFHSSWWQPARTCRNWENWDGQRLWKSSCQVFLKSTSSTQLLSLQFPPYCTLPRFLILEHHLENRVVFYQFLTMSYSPLLLWTQWDHLHLAVFLVSFLYDITRWLSVLVETFIINLELFLAVSLWDFFIWKFVMPLNNQVCKFVWPLPTLVRT